MNYKMAHTIQHLRRTIIPKTLILYQIKKPNSINPQLFSSLSHNHPFPIPPNCRNELTNSTKSAFENILLRVLRNEIQYEIDHFTQQPPTQFNGLNVEERPGEQYVSLGKRFGKGEEIKVEVTMFDRLIPKLKPGELPPLAWEKRQLHITLVISICKEKSNQVLEFNCSGWRDNLEIKKFFARDESKTPKNSPYTGPSFEELDPELQRSLYVFLKERGIDDNLCKLLHKFIHYKDKVEYIRWLESVKSVVEK